MDKYKVPPVFNDGSHRQLHAINTEVPDHIIEVPGSKSITNRALMLAALAKGRSTLEGVLFSDDSRHFLECLKDLGFDPDIDECAKTVSITGLGGRIPSDEASINVGSAGTAARFLTALLGCTKGIWHLDSSDQMKKRPMKPLLDALKSLGCRIVCHEQEDHFPFTIYSDGVTSGQVTVDITGSSQFLSALIMAAPIIGHDFTVNISGSHGMAYIKMTIEMMKQFGVMVTSRPTNTTAEGSKRTGEDTSNIPAEDMSTTGISTADISASYTADISASYTADISASYTVKGSSLYKAMNYRIEPDISAASYFYAMAAISGKSFLVKHVHPDSIQGDIKFLELLVKMGCSAYEYNDGLNEGILIHGPENGSIKGISADLSSYSDQALTLAAIAPFADSPVTIKNISHIRLQECDRIEAIRRNLSAMNIKTDLFMEDGGECIRIYPGEPQAAEIETYNDHRVAMAFTVTGLKAPGITILDPMCCRKTFETYYQTLERNVVRSAISN